MAEEKSLRGVGEKGMLEQTQFVIFKSDSRYSITECSRSGIKQAFMTDGCVSGDRSVLLRLSQIKPENVSIESYIEGHSGHLIFEDQTISPRTFARTSASEC